MRQRNLKNHMALFSLTSFLFQQPDAGAHTNFPNNLRRICREEVKFRKLLNFFNVQEILLIKISDEGKISK